MADNSKGGFINRTEKFLRRRKTKVLQSLGKTGRTTDEQIHENTVKLDKQQEVANKFQKDLRHYIHTARGRITLTMIAYILSMCFHMFTSFNDPKLLRIFQALASASKSFYTTLSETYEPEWEGHAQVQEILTSVDDLWQDYLQKLQDHVQDPLTKYLSCIPQIKARVAKRGRKLIDYDNAKHNLEVQQSAKKKDEAKVTKAQEDLDQAKKIYDDLNDELHSELPEFYNSRVTFYGNAFQHMFEAEHVFHQEIGKGAVGVAEVSEKLSKDNEQFTYTPRKNVRHTISQESDEQMPNGHSENGNSGYESPRQESPGASSPKVEAEELESPGPSPAPGPVPTPRKMPEPDSPGPSDTQMKAEVTVENGDNEADTSKESIDEGQGDYENADLSQQRALQTSGEVKVDEAATSEQVTIVTASESESIPSSGNKHALQTDQNIATKENVVTENTDVANATEKSENNVNENKDLVDLEYENVGEIGIGKPNAVDTNDADMIKTGHDSANETSDTSIKENKDQEAMKIEVDEEISGTHIKENDDKKCDDVETMSGTGTQIKEGIAEKKSKVHLAEVDDNKKAEVDETISGTQIKEDHDEVHVAEVHKEQTDKSDNIEPKEEAKINGVDLDTSTEQEPEIPDYPPPQPPSSEPPIEQKESPKEEPVVVNDDVHADDDDDVDGNTENLYQVPPPAKSVEDLPRKYIKTVISTHPYSGEDDDELTFEGGEVIYCVEYDDPDEQDPGWLMGVRKINNQKGVFPENFTKPV